MNDRTRAVALAALAVAVLVSCQASERVTADSATTSGGVTRCASGQSLISEYGVDDDPAAFGALTDARRDLYCANEDDGTLWWDKLDVRARKYVGDWLCSETPVYWTTSARSTSVSDSVVCAPGIAGNVWAMGVHGGVRPGDPTTRRTTSSTPEVITR